VALAQCADAAAGCIVTVDSDLTSFAAILAALGAVAVLIALLGIRFNRVKVAGAELTYEKATEGLAEAEPAGVGERNGALQDRSTPVNDVPVEVEVLPGRGKPLHLAPVAVTRLTRPMRDIEPALLRDYQSARNVSQHSYFLTHLLGRRIGSARSTRSLFASLRAPRPTRGWCRPTSTSAGHGVTRSFAEAKVPTVGSGSPRRRTDRSWPCVR
jgi:hypothetical protein